MSEHILAIDQGTTSTRAFLINSLLEIKGVSQKEFQQYYPRPGWVEHDPDEIWYSTEFVIEDCLKKSGVSASSIKGIGITNQRETTLLWARATGKPIYNAIVWQDRRTENICRGMKEKGLEELFRNSSGLVLDPYFSGTKIRWLLDNVDGAREKARRGELAFGTIDSFLVWRLTGGSIHTTDASNASRTLCMNLNSLKWDSELMDHLGIEPQLMPEIGSTSGILGKTKGLEVLPDGIPIASIIGDQQAALFGQACFGAGDSKCTFGTGSFLLMNTGGKPVASSSHLLTSVAWNINSRTTYALEGSTFIAGAAVQWLRDSLGIIRKASEIEALAGKVKSSEGVIFVPALTGLGAPHWRPDARGVISGITRGTTAAHIARATLEGIAFQQCDLVSAMAEDAKFPIKELRVDGGASQNNLLMQIQSDLLGIDITRPKEIETTVIGAACLAGLGVGIWNSQDEIKMHWKKERTFTPQISGDTRLAMLTTWRTAVKKSF